MGKLTPKKSSLSTDTAQGICLENSVAKLGVIMGNWSLKYVCGGGIAWGRGLFQIESYLGSDFEKLYMA